MRSFFLFFFLYEVLVVLLSLVACPLSGPNFSQRRGLLHGSLTLPHFLLQAMRSHENNEAQVCYFIIQLLLLKPNDFRNRVNDFVKENAPEHWLQSDWHNKHMNYYKVKMNRY